MCIRDSKTPKQVLTAVAFSIGNSLSSAFIGNKENNFKFTTAVSLLPTQKLADEDSRYHSVVTFFMEFHRDDVGPDIAAELFPGTDPAKLSFAEMVDFLRLDRFGSLVDYKMDQQVFIMDLSLNPEITDELMVIYFDLNQEIFCITNES